MKKKNIFVHAFCHELRTGVGVNKITHAIEKLYGHQQSPFNWFEDGRTEKELVTLLRKIGYEIPKDTQGSDKIYKLAYRINISNEKYSWHNSKKEGVSNAKSKKNIHRVWPGF